VTGALGFRLPPERQARNPPEARGLSRDEVRLMVSCGAGDSVAHRRFRDLPGEMEPGDLLVVNTSATLAAAVPAMPDESGGAAAHLWSASRFRIHLSTVLADGAWAVEVRERHGTATRPWFAGRPGERFALPGGGSVRLETPYALPGSMPPLLGRVRLWRAQVALPDPAPAYLGRHGRPIRYNYVDRDWPIETYQTVFAKDPGSAEMPSAGRAFSVPLVRALRRRGVGLAEVLLHTGVASLESDEGPYEEFYAVSARAAEQVERTRRSGGRVVAVGTTVVRALETAADETGRVEAGSGWTRLVVTPGRGVLVVDALLTGFHEPRSSHLAMLEALVGREHLERTYRQAVEQGYLWHEFGDLHLLVNRCLRAA